MSEHLWSGVQQATENGALDLRGAVRDGGVVLEVSIHPEVRAGATEVDEREITDL